MSSIPFTIEHERYRPNDSTRVVVHTTEASARAAGLPVRDVDFSREVLVELAAEAPSWPASLRVSRVVATTEGTTIDAFVDHADDGDHEACWPATTVRLPTVPLPITWP